MPNPSAVFRRTRRPATPWAHLTTSTGVAEHLGPIQVRLPV